MQSIQTKYLPPTNYRGARIKATASGGLSITVSYTHELKEDEEHDAAFTALCVKLGWHGLWYRGDLKRGYVYVCSRNQAGITQRHLTVSK